VDALPSQHGRNHLVLDKVKTIIIESLWNFPSDTTVQKFLFVKRNLAQVLGYIKPIKSVTTWKKFVQVPAFVICPEYETARQLGYYLLIYSSYAKFKLFSLEIGNPAQHIR
jgi:hypothetical protein